MSDRRKQSEYREVYSTNGGALCVDCGKPLSGCVCAAQKRLAPLGDGTVRIRRETKGRGGKTVTSISGLAMNMEQAAALLKDLKRICGTGGALKDSCLELQGDRLEVVTQELAKRGIRAKRAGG
jgi:translation initiation factor 1